MRSPVVPAYIFRDGRRFSRMIASTPSSLLAETTSSPQPQMPSTIQRTQATPSWPCRLVSTCLRNCDTVRGVRFFLGFLADTAGALMLSVGG
ncbi:hypothetical protein D9M69_624420 [compost metagenome]